MGRQHPLDVFRSNQDGFDKASQRRTVAGKVIASSVKHKVPSKARSGLGSAAGTVGKAKPKASKRRSAGASRASSQPKASQAKPPRLSSGARLFAPAWGKQGKSKAKSKGARKAEGATRTIFFGAIVMLSAVVLVVVFKQFWLGDGVSEMPTMKLGDVLPPGPGHATTAAQDAGDGAAAVKPDWFTIRAAVYNGSERGQELAVAAHRELAQRGLPGVTLIGHEAESAGSYSSFELIVGAARTEAALQGALDALLAIDNWPGGKAAPFVDARIVAHPVPDSLGEP